MTHVILPDLGEGISKATVACWHYQEGDAVKAGDEICEVATDKAVFNVEASVSGCLKAILVKQGEEGLVGSVLGVIE